VPIWEHKRCNWCAYSKTIIVVFSRPAIRCLVTKLAILFDDEQQAPEGMFQNLDKIRRYDITERHVLREVMHSSLFQRHIIRNLHSPWMTQGSRSSRSARVDPCHTQRSAYLSRLGCSWQIQLTCRLLLATPQVASSNQTFQDCQEPISKMAGV
jgi:hypothetical protein